VTHSDMKNNQQINELMNLVLDGEADAGQRLELDGLLASDVRLQAQFAQLGAAAKAMSGLSKAEPPADSLASI
jgi:anti-sigma factor RsiW